MTQLTNTHASLLKDFVKGIHLNKLMCIKVTHKDIASLNSTFENFRISFIKERWKGEQRRNYIYSIFGRVHTKTITTSPMNEKSIRLFDFPHTKEEAEERHIEASIEHLDFINYIWLEGKAKIVEALQTNDYTVTINEDNSFTAKDVKGNVVHTGYLYYNDRKVYELYRCKDTNSVKADLIVDLQE